MLVSLKGFDEKIITLQASDSVTAGVAVSISGNNEVTAASEGTDVFGLALSVREGYAAVQVGGFATLPCANIEDARVGYQGITGADDGAVSIDDSGRKVFILSVNETDGTIGIIL